MDNFLSWPRKLENWLKKLKNLPNKLKNKAIIYKNLFNKLKPQQKTEIISYTPVLIKHYEITGINKETNRKKKIIVYAKTKEIAETKVLELGLLPPYKTEVIFDEPTDRQIEYAKALGISIPENASFEDVSCLISRKVDDDNNDPNPGLLEFADNRDMISSKYHGKKSLYNLVFNNLTGTDKIAFFVFCIYRYFSDDRHANLDTHPYKEIFYQFADSVATDNSFLKSLNRYSGSDLRFFGEMRLKNGYSISGGSMNTIAFKKAAEFLKETFNIKFFKIKWF